MIISENDKLILTMVLFPVAQGFEFVDLDSGSVLDGVFYVKIDKQQAVWASATS